MNKDRQAEAGSDEPQVNIEEDLRTPIGIEEEDSISDDEIQSTKIEFVKSIAELRRQLPDDYNPHYRNFIEGYAAAQLLAEKGRPKKAARKLYGIKNREWFDRFEDANPQLFAAIDIAIRGTSKREDYQGNPIKPSWVINEVKMFNED